MSVGQLSSLIGLGVVVVFWFYLIIKYTEYQSKGGGEK